MDTPDIEGAPFLCGIILTHRVPSKLNGRIIIIIFTMRTLKKIIFSCTQ